MPQKRSIITRKRYLFQAYRFWKENFDPKRGMFGGLVMGFTIFLINANHGIWLALSAMVKQGIFTFTFGGVFVKMAENFSLRYKKRGVAYFTAAFIPAGLSILTTYALHSLKGTPEPFNSTLPAILTAPPAFAVWGYKTRKKWDREELLRKKMERKRKKRKSVSYRVVSHHGKFTP